MHTGTWRIDQVVRAAVADLFVGIFCHGHWVHVVMEPLTSERCPSLILSATSFVVYRATQPCWVLNAATLWILSDTGFEWYPFLCLSEPSSCVQAGNLQVVEEAFAEIGYNLMIFRIAATQYGLPQSRVRLLFLAVARDSSLMSVVDSDAYFASVTTMMKDFRRDAPSFLDVLLPTDDDDVENELTAKSLTERAAQNPAEQGWPGVHSDYYSMNNMRWLASKPKQCTNKSPWFAMLTERQQQVLILVQHQLGTDVGVDLSQCIGRTPTTSMVDGKVVAPTVLPGMQLWLGWPQHARIMLGREAMTIQASLSKFVLRMVALHS
jgi:site-specific DNA-cytosine methylase